MNEAIVARLNDVLKRTWLRSLEPLLFGRPGASNATLRKRVTYGGKKGRIAKRRLGIFGVIRMEAL